MATFWKIAAQSVDRMFSLYFDYFLRLVISRFGFEGWIWVLIASVSVQDLSILFTFRLFLTELHLNIYISVIYQYIETRNLQNAFSGFHSQFIQGH